MGFLNWWRSSPAPAPKPAPEPQGQNNYLLIVLDSCRFDSLLAAKPKHLLKLGPLEKRWSYASWTAPAHYNLLMEIGRAHV